MPNYDTISDGRANEESSSISADMTRHRRTRGHHQKDGHHGQASMVSSVINLLNTSMSSPGCGTSRKAQRKSRAAAQDILTPSALQSSALALWRCPLPFHISESFREYSLLYGRHSLLPLASTYSHDAHDISTAARRPSSPYPSSHTRTLL